MLAQRPAPVRRHAAKHHLNFPVLIDKSREVIKAYGVWHQFGITAWNIARPALFLVDRDGVIRYSFVGKRQDDFPSHEEILRELDRLGRG